MGCQADPVALVLCAAQMDKTVELVVHCGMVGITDTDYAVYFGDCCTAGKNGRFTSVAKKGQTFWFDYELKKDQEPNNVGLYYPSGQSLSGLQAMRCSMLKPYLPQ